jgi:hypothetical protein
MTDAEYNKWSDPKNWDDGPWVNEPGMELIEFEYKGRRCFLKRDGTGAWCGYVAIKIDSPYVSCENRIKLVVHGDATYCSNSFRGIPEIEGHVMLAFMCNNSGDFSPLSFTFQQQYLNRLSESARDLLRTKTDYEKKGPVYRTLEFATNELRSMVDQMEDPDDNKGSVCK